MDQDLQQRIEEAKAAGYSDEEIAKALGTAPPPPQATLPGGPTVPILSAEEKAQFNRNEKAVEERNTGENVSTGVLAAGAGAAAVGVPIAAYKIGKAVLSPASQGVKQFAQQGLNTANRVAGAMEGRTAVDAAREARMSSGGAYGRAAQGVRGPVAPTYNVPTSNVPQMRAPVPGAVSGPVAPTMQNRVQAAAAKRVVGLGVPGAVAAGGLAATGLAGGQMAAMTPEQRKAYYDNMMLGAMGGDAALAAAIMNGGQ